ncbi:MAG: DUF1501 domain-containing protein [Epsilonproteobacteria bacterium]|nr:DUF1501 domain-containing protein [Campylobacterota bacterium]
MKRRAFIKLSAAVASTLFISNRGYAADVDISRVNFNHNTFTQNGAQTIMIFLYGGASELSGNLTNIDEIKEASQSSYDNYFRGVTKTVNGFWQEAGGTFMESLVASEDLNVFRTMFSRQRDEENNKSHGRCVAQNQRGAFREEGAGIFSTLARVLTEKGAIDANAVLPFMTMEGESSFFAKGDTPLAGFVNPVGVNERLDNPYIRESVNQWYFYTEAERDANRSNYSDFTPLLDAKLNQTAQTHNREGVIKEAFSKRGSLETFIEDIKTKTVPDGVSYPGNNDFAEKLEAAVKILVANPDTKVISLGSAGLGGWDDHNEARDYVSRMESLFSALSAAMDHIKAESKEDKINITIFGDFGRNVNLNSALGWDHGNNQNLFLLGGKDYFNSVGVVGETALDNSGALNRLYLKPKTGSYEFEPISVAATLYKIYGIENPEVLTGGYGVIEGGLLK